MNLIFFHLLSFFLFFLTINSISIKSLLFPGLQNIKNSTNFKGIFEDAIAETVITCPENCNNHGSCNNSSCICEKDYQGSSCSTYCPNNCNLNGYCAIGLGCLCSENFQGFITLNKFKIKQNLLKLRRGLSSKTLFL